MEENESNFINLKDIKEKLKRRITRDQKKSLLKKTLIDGVIVVLMILYLGVVLAGKQNIAREIFIKDLQFLTLCIMVIGIYFLEYAYKKDSISYMLNSIEIIIYAAINLAIVYVVKLYETKFLKVICCLILAIFIYYVLKVLYINIKSIRRFRKDNNDIREIIKNNKLKN